jgi:hypothetical protein
MNVESLEDLKETVLSIKRESVNWLVDTKLSFTIEYLLSLLDNKILELKYTPIMSQEDYDSITHKMNKLLVFCNGELEPEYCQSFNLDELKDKVKELNEKNIKNADKVAIFSNDEPKIVGQFKRLR